MNSEHGSVEPFWTRRTSHPAPRAPFAGQLFYSESRLMVFTVCVGPRHPRNFSFLFSSASVAWKNFSSSSIARAGRRRTSCKSPSKGERSGTAKIRSFLSSELSDLQDFKYADGLQRS